VGGHQRLSDGQQTTAAAFESQPGLLISIIAIDSDTIGDTFRVSLSVSAIHFCESVGIGDTFVGGIAIDYRQYF
jgi:hypothetical protein